METLKVRATILLKIFFQRFEIRKAILDDRPPLFIQAVLTVEKIDDAAADDRIQGHQRSFVPAGHARPAGMLMSFPQSDDDVSVHLT